MIIELRFLFLKTVIYNINILYYIPLDINVRIGPSAEALTILNKVSPQPSPLKAVHASTRAACQVATMPALPSFSTLLYWTCYLVPVYLFIVAPGLRTLFPGQPPAVFFDDDFYGPDELAPVITETEDSGNELNCADDAYRVHLFSRSPLVIYIEDFLSRTETEHLLAIRSFFPCNIFNKANANGTVKTNTPLQPSSTAPPNASTHPYASPTAHSCLQTTASCNASNPAPARSRAGAQTCPLNRCGHSGTMSLDTTGTITTGQAPHTRMETG